MYFRNQKQSLLHFVCESEPVYYNLLYSSKEKVILKEKKSVNVTEKSKL